MEKTVARDSGCSFCKIVSVEIPASVVYENDSLVAFMDINPLADGHLLVIPRDHYRTLDEMPPAACGQLCAALPILGRALLDVTGASGYNVLQSNKQAAGQVVPHVHFHLIPRQPVDDLGFRWNAKRYPPGRAEELAGEFQRVLAPKR